MFVDAIVTTTLGVHQLQVFSGKETTQVKHKLKLPYFQVKTFQVRLNV